MNDRLRALQATVDKLVASRQLAIADEPSTAPTGRRAEEDYDKWVAVDQGKLHRCASFSLRTPSCAWRTTCGVRFAIGRARFSLLDLAEAEASKHPRCE
eukprot:7844733-Lingulodinium_polyedra.AAC.1